jgi:hypothetical protein
MTGQSRVRTQIRISTNRRPVVRYGLFPAVFVTLVTAGLLWGTGHDLPSVPPVAGQTDFRSAIAWLAVVASLLALAYSFLGGTVGMIQGTWRRFWLTSLYFRVYMPGQRRKRRRLAERASQPGDPSSTDSSSSLDLNFPASAESLRPTGIGNAQAALADRMTRQHGLDLEVIWIPLTSILSKEDRRLLTNSEYDADKALYVAAGWLMSTIVLSPIIWIVAAFEVRKYGWASFPESIAASAMVTMFLYAIEYRRAKKLAVKHGQLVESRVLLYHHELMKRVGLRTPSPAEEREFGEALSERLAGQVIDSRFLAETAIVDETGRDEIAEIVERGVERGLHRGLVADEELDNFDGHISAWILDGDQDVQLSEDGKFLISYGHDYRIVVTIGERARERGITAPVVIRRGSDQHYIVPFDLNIDSNIPDLNCDERSVEVALDGERQLEIPLLIAESTRNRWIWLRLIQRGRTIQNLELRFLPEGSST